MIKSFKWRWINDEWKDHTVLYEDAERVAVGPLGLGAQITMESYNPDSETMIYLRMQVRHTASDGIGAPLADSVTRMDKIMDNPKLLQALTLGPAKPWPKELWPMITAYVEEASRDLLHEAHKQADHKLRMHESMVVRLRNALQDMDKVVLFNGTSRIHVTRLMAHTVMMENGRNSEPPFRMLAHDDIVVCYNRDNHEMAQIKFVPDNLEWNEPVLVMIQGPEDYV